MTADETELADVHSAKEVLVVHVEDDDIRISRATAITSAKKEGIINIVLCWINYLEE